MAVARDERPRSRGRPRKQGAERLVRRTITVAPGDLELVRTWYGAKSDAEALRMAFEGALARALLQDIHDHLADYGPDNDYDPNRGKSKLPVYLKPGDVPPDELVPFPDENA